MSPMSGNVGYRSPGGEVEDVWVRHSQAQRQAICQVQDAQEIRFAIIKTWRATSRKSEYLRGLGGKLELAGVCDLPRVLRAKATEGEGMLQLRHARPLAWCPIWGVRVEG